MTKSLGSKGDSLIMSIPLLLILIVCIGLTCLLNWRSAVKEKTDKIAEGFSLTITPSQREQFLSRLGNIPANIVNTFAVEDDYASIYFANELNNLMRSAGYQTDDIRKINFEGYPKGLIIAVHSSQQLPVYAWQLQMSLQEIG